MKEKKNIILLIIAIILFLVALIFLVWSTKQKNIDNTNINNTNEILEENIEPQREIESSNTQDVEGVSYQDISIYTEDETQVKLSEFSEQPVMILFWNPENEDSVEVLKKVNGRYSDYKDKIEFLMISTSKEIPEELKSEISMKIYYDLNGECQEMYNATVIPTMVYIDGNNEVINAKSGVPSNDAIEANLDLISNNF